MVRARSAATSSAVGHACTPQPAFPSRSLLYRPPPPPPPLGEATGAGFNRVLHAGFTHPAQLRGYSGDVSSPEVTWAATISAMADARRGSSFRLGARRK